VYYTFGSTLELGEIQTAAERVGGLYCIYKEIPPLVSLSNPHRYGDKVSKQLY